MIIAVDFDGTLCEHKFPEIGKAHFEIMDMLAKMRRSGVKLILHTCRDGKYLEEAIQWCKNRGLQFDSVNEDIKEIKDSEFGKSKSNKVYADYYLDDRNLDLDTIYHLDKFIVQLFNKGDRNEKEQYV